MDAAAQHYATREPRYAKGVALLCFPGDPAGVDNSATAPSDQAGVDDPATTSGLIGAGEAKTEYIEVGKIFVDASSKRMCQKCNTTEHSSEMCPQSLTCHGCKKTGHKKVDCPERSKCRVCNGTGHMARDCPDKKSKKGHCYSCGEPGHKTAACTKRDDQLGAPSSSEAPVETADNEEPMTQPGGVFQPVESDDIEVHLQMHDQPLHISSLSLQFRSSYPNPSAANKTVTKSALVRFTAANIAGPEVTVEEIDVDHQLVAKLSETVRSSIQARFKNVAEGDPVPVLHCVQFKVLPDAQLLGLAMFSNGEYGPKNTSKMHHIRDVLAKRGHMIVTFLSFDKSIDNVESVANSMLQQAQETPLLGWFPGRTVRIQRGLELPPDARPDHGGTVPARFQFDRKTELLTVHFYGAIEELEAIPGAQYVRTKVRLVSFADSNQRVFVAIIEMTEELGLHVDSTFALSFQAHGGDLATDWKGVVVTPMPCHNGLEHCAFIRRPHSDDGGWVDEPKFDPEHFVAASDFRTMEALRDAIHEHPGINVGIQVQEPKNSLHREINTLHELWEKKDEMADLMSVLLNNNPRSLPTLDYLADLGTRCGDDVVRDAVRQTEEDLGLREKQLEFFPYLRGLVGGIGLVQGVAGAGKSMLIEAMVYLQYVLTCAGHAPGQIWIASPVNQQLDDLANRIFQRLMRCYDPTGPNAKFPVVVRKHMKGTEKSVYMERFIQVRKKKGLYPNYEYIVDDDDKSDTDDESDTEVESVTDGKSVTDDNSDTDDKSVTDGKSVTDDNSDTDDKSVTDGKSVTDDKSITGDESSSSAGPEAAEDTSVKEDAEDTSVGEDTKEAELMDMACTLAFRRRYDDHVTSSGDKRLRQVGLSEGQWVLHLIGEPIDSNGTRHAIADDHYRHVRDRLIRYADGEDFSREQKDELTQGINEAKAGVAALATVILMTPHVLSESRTHSISKPNVVVHDEAGKTTERSALHAVAWSHESADDPKFHVLFGDTFQPKPIMDRGKDKRTFRDQSAVTLFQRLLFGGLTQLWLDRQYRYVQPIADLVNSILPGEQISTDDSTASILGADSVRTLFQQMGFRQPCGFMQVKGNAQMNPISKSKYNSTNAEHALGIVLHALGSQMKGSQIGIAVPYTAQVSVYTAGIEALLDWVKEQITGGSKTFTKDTLKELAAVAVFTVDGIQGMQKDIIIFDTVVAGELGFLNDSSRIHLAISRARLGLLVIGDAEACANGAPKRKLHEKSAYYRMVYYCKTPSSKGSYVNRDDPRNKETVKKWLLSDKVATAIQVAHAPRNTNLQAFQLDEDQPAEMGEPTHAAAMHGDAVQAGSNELGWGETPGGWGQSGGNEADDGEAGDGEAGHGEAAGGDGWGQSNNAGGWD